MNPLEAYGLLGLEVGASPTAIRVAFMDRAKVAHPDVGGTVDDWNRFTLARDTALGDARAARCLKCAGKGRRSINRGFSGISIVCGECSGTGKRYPIT